MAVVISHIYNESYLLPFWLEYHKKIFKHGIIIDYHSTDDSLNIVKHICPTWDIVTTRNETFGAVDIDTEVMDIESRISGYKIVLNTTEWLIISDKLENILIENCYSMKPMVLSRIDINRINNTYEFMKNFTHMAKNYTERGGIRIIHNHLTGLYHIGRHETHHKAMITDKIFLVWCGMYPNNTYTISRKLAIKYMIPIYDIQVGMGFSHMYSHEKICDELKIINKLGEDVMINDKYKLSYDYSINLLDKVIDRVNGIVNFIICSSNSASYLRLCLNSILHYMKNFIDEVTIIYRCDEKTTNSYEILRRDMMKIQLHIRWVETRNFKNEIMDIVNNNKYDIIGISTDKNIFCNSISDTNNIKNVLLTGKAISYIPNMSISLFQTIINRFNINIIHVLEDDLFFWKIEETGLYRLPLFLVDVDMMCNPFIKIGNFYERIRLCKYLDNLYNNIETLFSSDDIVMMCSTYKHIMKYNLSVMID